MFYIYRITNLINGKTYIGQHKYKETPYDDYMGSGKILKQAYTKYGMDNFIKDIIVANIEDKETIDKLEIKYIAFERASNGNGCYNIADGGNGDAGPRSEETKRKISKALKGRHISEEWKRKISEANKGRKPSDSTIQKVKEVNKGRLVSEETHRKLSEAHKGKKPNRNKKHWKIVDGKRVWY